MPDPWSEDRDLWQYYKCPWIHLWLFSLEIILEGISYNSEKRVCILYLFTQPKDGYILLTISHCYMSEKRATHPFSFLTFHTVLLHKIQFRFLFYDNWSSESLDHSCCYCVQNFEGLWWQEWKNLCNNKHRKLTETTIVLSIICVYKKVLTYQQLQIISALRVDFAKFMNLKSIFREEM